MLEKKNLKNLLPGIDCAECAHAYGSESVNIVREEDGLLVLKIKCYNCGKCFGMAYLGLEKDELEKTLPDVMGGTCPIGYDDVLDAHKYFKNMDENWREFMNTKKNWSIKNTLD